MALRGAQGHDQSDCQVWPDNGVGSADIRTSRSGRRGGRKATRTQARHGPSIPKRYRPKRLVGPDQRLKDEKERAMKLSQQFNLVSDLKKQISEGRKDLVSDWMALSRGLIDEFRSLKRFYSWEKYLRFLGSSDSANQQSVAGSEHVDPKLSEMYERLNRCRWPLPYYFTSMMLTRNSQAIAPQANNSNQSSTSAAPRAHQGISFDDWLNLFLDYAIGLATEHKRQEAYQVCEAARDSTAFQSLNSNFTIYVTWSGKKCPRTCAFQRRNSHKH